MREQTPPSILGVSAEAHPVLAVVLMNDLQLIHVRAVRFTIVSKDCMHECRDLHDQNAGLLVLARM